MSGKRKFRDIKNNENLVDLPPNIQPHFRIGIYGIITHKNNILLIKDGRSGEGEFPGGGLDIGEEIKAGFIREIKEETGYDVTFTEKPIHASDELIFHEQKNTYSHAISLFFTGSLVSQTQSKLNLDTPDEIIDMKWVSVNELNSHSMIAYHKKAFEVFNETN